MNDKTELKALVVSCYFIAVVLMLGMIMMIIFSDYLREHPGFAMLHLFMITLFSGIALINQSKI